MKGWGLYPWFSEGGLWLVHGDDVERFEALSPYSKVFKCTGKRDGYLILRYGIEDYRVRPDLFEPVPAPAFGFEEWVTMKASGRNRAPHIGTIREIHWDYKKRCPYYLLRIGGRELPKRYWTEDLERLRV